MSDTRLEHHADANSALVLVGWSEGCDLEKLLLAEQSVEIDTQGVGGELGVQPRTQSPEGVRLMSTDPKVIGELAVHRLDDLAQPVQALGSGLWELLVLIPPRHAEQMHILRVIKRSRNWRAHIAFVAQRVQRTVFRQQFRPDRQISGVG